MVRKLCLFRRGLQGCAGGGEEAGPGPQPEPDPRGLGHQQDGEGVPTGGPRVPGAVPAHLHQRALCRCAGGRIRK